MKGKCYKTYVAILVLGGTTLFPLPLSAGEGRGASVHTSEPQSEHLPPQKQEIETLLQEAELRNERVQMELDAEEELRQVPQKIDSRRSANNATLTDPSGASLCSGSTGSGEALPPGGGADSTPPVKSGDTIRTPGSGSGFTTRYAPPLTRSDYYSIRNGYIPRTAPCLSGNLPYSNSAEQKIVGVLSWRTFLR